MSTDDSNGNLFATVQRQSDTIEALHAATAQYKARADAAEELAAGRITEAEALRGLQAENHSLRSENFSLTERVKELEAAISRSAEASSLTAESQAQLGVQVRAYQRHNHFLHGEVSSRDAKQRALEERVEVLEEELKTKDKRMSLMMDRLRKHNVDMARMNEENNNQEGGGGGGALPARVTVPEATLQQIREKMAVQTSTIELLRERLEAVEEESARKEHVLKSMRRENNALKQTISKMVAQISQEVTASATEMALTSDALLGRGNPNSTVFDSSSSPGGGAAGAGGGGGMLLQSQQSISAHLASPANNQLGDDHDTGAGYLMGLGGAATGNAQLAANPSAFVESEAEAEQRLKAFRNRRLQEFTSPAGGAAAGRK